MRISHNLLNICWINYHWLGSYKKLAMNWVLQTAVSEFVWKMKPKPQQTPKQAQGLILSTACLCPIVYAWPIWSGRLVCSGYLWSNNVISQDCGSAPSLWHCLPSGMWFHVSNAVYSFFLVLSIIYNNPEFWESGDIWIMVSLIFF